VVRELVPRSVGNSCRLSARFSREPNPLAITQNHKGTEESDRDKIVISTPKRKKDISRVLNGNSEKIRLVPVDNSLIFINFMSLLRAKRTDSLTNRFFLLSIRPV